MNFIHNLKEVKLQVTRNKGFELRTYLAIRWMKSTQSGTMINTEKALSKACKLEVLFTGLLMFKLYHLTSLDQRLLALEEDLRKRVTYCKGENSSKKILQLSNYGGVKLVFLKLFLQYEHS